ncbi:MAG: ABC transporter substrate-binding protein [Dehalococcoidia bacterium]|jgi:ABC-type branched-subunit amino acid transport system substrate-binding protein
MKHSKEKSAHGRRFWLVVLSLVGILSLVAMSCGGSSKQQTSNTPAGTTAPGGTSAPGAKGQLKVGILFDFTGDLSEFGPNMLNGAKLAAKDIDDNGGVMKQDIVLKQADSQTSSAPAVDAARQLVESDGVSAIIGSLSSGVTLAVAEGVTVPDKILQISPASTSPALTDVQDNDLLFRTTLSDAAQGLVLAKLANQLGYKSVSTLYVNNAYGQGLSDNFKAAFEALGGTVPATVPHEQEQASYLSELQKATAGNPDAVAALSYPQSAQVYLKEGFDNGLLKQVLFCDGTQSKDIITAVGADKLEGMEGTVSAAAAIPTDWQSEFEAAYGPLPNLPYIAESYDAVIMVALGAEKAQSTDPLKIRDAMRTLNDPSGTKVTSGAAGIKQALDLIHQGKPINYQGASGFSGWDKNGDLPSGYIKIWKYSGGQIVDVSTEAVTMPTPSP